jgi:Ni/Co efflux regulator RcnB
MRTRASAILAAVALAGLAGFWPAVAAADPPHRGGYGHGQHHRGDDDDDDWAEDYWEHREDGWRRDERRRHREERAHRREREREHSRYRSYDNHGGYDRYSGYNGYSGYDPYGDYRSWNARAHNGYYYRDQWYWGAPPRDRWRDCRPAYRRPAHGSRLPRGYVVVPIDDWRGYGLYAPPRGHRWAQDESGTYFLLGLATGVILDSVLRGY